MAVWTVVDGFPQRPFGDSEAAFYPASQVGLGDMFLHLSFTAPKKYFQGSRAAIVWAIIRNRHPLLMCKVVLNGQDNTPHFLFSPPINSDIALKEANETLFLKNESKIELISKYMNGPRMLSDEHLSYLVISQGSNRTDDEVEEYGLFMCAPHFTGDGTSLHQSSHDFLSLLVSPMSDSQLLEELQFPSDWMPRLPPTCESRCSQSSNALVRAVSKVNFLQTLDKEIGGHTFSRTQQGPQKTVIVEREFTETQTAAILKRCKANGVTINHVLSALCNVVWGRSVSNRESFKNPMMMYTAINLRSYLTPHPASTYWFLALTYFNIVLPSFPPSTQEVFWHRARLAKAQARRAVESRFLVARSLEMANIRASRSRGSPRTLPSLRSPSTSSLPPAPSAALLGLSLIGNLDSIYVRSSYPSIHLYSVTTASRQKAGGLLLLQHTFGGKLWLNLCWDENGFKEGHIEQFWQGLQDCVEEYLI